MNKNIPVVTKNVTTIFSVAVRERFMCHGLIASKNELMVANLEFWNNSLTNTYVASIVSVPKSAEAKRVEKALKPKILMKGIDR